jgi:protein ImuB
MQPEISAGRRILAVVLTDFLMEAALGFELTEARLQKRKQPLGVVVVEESEELISSRNAPLKRLLAVSPLAERLGVQLGDRVSEAEVRVAHLEVKAVTVAKLTELLLAVAEVLRNFGSSVSLSPWLKEALAQTTAEKWVRKSLPCVWVDVTGVGHLYGSEEELAYELRERVRLLGHSVQIAIAPGPELSRAYATHGALGAGGIRIVRASEVEKTLVDLPIWALPLDSEKVEFFALSGLFLIRDLAALPRAAVVSRLGTNALKILELLQGQDDAPLVPCTFASQIEEQIEFEEGASGLEPMLFALRGLVARSSARLEGRGQAASRLSLQLLLESSSTRRIPELKLDFELAAPIWREGELFRVVRSRLEKLELEAICVGMKLSLAQLGTRATTQLQMGRGQAASAVEQSELPILLAELEGDLGKTRVGTLSVEARHRPEERTSLNKMQFQSSKKPRRGAARSCQSELDRATRLFAQAIPLVAPLAVGQTLIFMQSLYTIEKLKFVERFEGVNWWTEGATSRDYFWAMLSGTEGVVEALTFVNRKTGERFIQGLRD